METYTMKKQNLLKPVFVLGVIAVVLELLSSLLDVFLPYIASWSIWQNSIASGMMSMVFPVLIAAAAVLFFAMLTFTKMEGCVKALKVISAICLVLSALVLFYVMFDALMVGVLSTTVHNMFGDVVYILRGVFGALIWPLFLLGALAQGLKFGKK